MAIFQSTLGGSIIAPRTAGISCKRGVQASQDEPSEWADTLGTELQHRSFALGRFAGGHGVADRATDFLRKRLSSRSRKARAYLGDRRRRAFGLSLPAPARLRLMDALSSLSATE